jgi:twitching motility protein PilT
MGASDLHITGGTPPRSRVHGDLRPMDYPTLSADECRSLIYSVMTDQQKFQYEEQKELDFSFGVKNLARFRANVFTQRESTAAVFRMIPFEILSLTRLGLPDIIGTFAKKPRGLILITGPTGSGKSTTLAALIDLINQEKPGHIITVEDPIEFLHSHKQCLINQREVHSDTKSFANALRVILREDPDVVLIGEMRDLETMEAALRIAETGHLTFGTLHTNSAYTTINRLVDSFPPHQQQQIRAQLSLVLEGIVCQSLLPKSDGSGRVAACEILIPTSGIRNLIRENKVHQIYSMMQAGQQKYGMLTMNQSLAQLYLEKKISRQTCLNQSSNPDELKQILARSGDPAANRNN